MLLSRSPFGVTLFSFFYFIFFYFCQLACAPKPAGQPMFLSLLRPHLRTHAHMHIHIHMQAHAQSHTNTNTHSCPYPVTQQIGIGVFGPGWVRPCPRNWPTSWRWQRQRKRYRCSASSSLQSCSFVPQLPLLSKLFFNICSGCWDHNKTTNAALPKLNVKFSWTASAGDAFDNQFNEISPIKWHSYSLHCN